MDRKKLRELAKKATQGTWENEEQAVQSDAVGSLHVAWCGTGISAGKDGTFDIDIPQAKANAAYIAAVQPGVVIDLLDALDAAENVAAKAKEALSAEVVSAFRENL